MGCQLAGPANAGDFDASLDAPGCDCRFAFPPAPRHRAFDFHPSMRQVITEAWININGKGHFNYSHDHPGSLFSAVYYVKGGADKGELELKTPIVPHTYTISNEMVGGFNYIMPNDGNQGAGLNGGFTQESWGLAMNLVWYVGRPKAGVHNTPFRPLFNVADNNVMMFERQ